MPAVVIATASVTPPSTGAVPGWNRVRSTLTSWDEKVWDLTNPDMGVFLTRGDVRGLGHTKFEHHRDESPAVAGALYRGTSFGPREVSWPVHLFHDGSSREFVERDRAWWKSLHPRHEGVWTVEVPGVSKRHLRVRCEGDGGWAPQGDPTFFGWATYVVALQADQPFWYEELEPKVFETSDPLTFFGTGDPGAPLFNISKSNTLASATITNPGDEPAYPIWTLYGPFESASVTVGGLTIEVPFALNEGEWLRLDSTPTELTAFDNEGNDRFTELGEAEWGAVPEGGTSALDIVITAEAPGAKVMVELTALYHRAW